MTKFTGSFDTNVVLRLLLNDIPKQHMAAKKLMEQAVNQFAIADTVIIELVFGLDRYYGFSRPQIADAVDGLMNLKGINCNRALFERALPLFVNRGGLSFEDCCLAVYSVLNDAEPLWTFDKKLARQASSAKLVNL
ncbi:MAG TPA: PIN domain-containing protein [Candidatus Saccharimonadales bacterium]|nr:PIN domain-containing protein [Candidatus Saccharimonadales bacterium]